MRNSSVVVGNKKKTKKKLTNRVPGVFCLWSEQEAAGGLVLSWKGRVCCVPRGPLGESCCRRNRAAKVVLLPRRFRVHEAKAKRWERPDGERLRRAAMPTAPCRRVLLFSM
ncbi:hypothetical protein MRX96_027095 [Rhipicephalus microplus]